MFDIGFGELLIIAIVALVVLGPERLPKAARFAGLWVRRARAQWHSVRDELERELAADELKRSLRDTEDAMKETERRIREGAAATEREFEDLRQSVRGNGRVDERVDEEPIVEPELSSKRELAQHDALEEPSQETAPDDVTPHGQGRP